MVGEAIIAVGKFVIYFYIFFVIILIGLIVIAGLLRILTWTIKGLE